MYGDMFDDLGFTLFTFVAWVVTITATITSWLGGDVNWWLSLAGMASPWIFYVLYKVLHAIFGE